MPDPAYVAAALAAAVGITFAVRAVPFAMKNAIKESALLGRHRPVDAARRDHHPRGLLTHTTVDITTPTALASLVGVAATIAIHWWRRNAVLGILTGTAAYLAMINWIVPT